MVKIQRQYFSSNFDCFRIIFSLAYFFKIRLNTRVLTYRLIHRSIVIGVGDVILDDVWHHPVWPAVETLVVIGHNIAAADAIVALTQFMAL